MTVINFNKKRKKKQKEEKEKKASHNRIKYGQKKIDTKINNAKKSLLEKYLDSHKISTKNEQKTER